MSVLMKALRTFASAEGFFKRGETFEVKSDTRAEEFERRKFAERIEQQGIPPSMSEEAPLPEDEKPQESTEDAEAPAQNQTWGLKAVGGDWYEIPGGERTRGFEQAKEHLYVHLMREFEPDRAPAPKDAARNEEEITPANAEMRLIEPVTEPEIVNPEEEASEEGESLSEGDPNEGSFETEVKYLGGGWYVLPNEEKVQGEESARDLYETYKKGGDS